MREIKFRAWGGENKEHYHFVYFDLLNQMEDWVQSSEIDRVTGGQPVMRKDEIITIQQWTGLLDKNGKEIYEGDIVKVLGYKRNRDDYKDCLGEVQWCNKCNCSWRLQIIGWANEELISNFTMEIIGNIYENSDLLQSNPKGE